MSEWKGLYPVACFVTGCLEPLGSATRYLVISKLDRRRMGCEDWKWMELAQEHVQWRDLVLAMSKLRVLLPESYLIRTMDFQEIGCEDGSRKPRLTAVGIRCADHATPSIRKSWH
jgi:hypothetical protein